MARYKRFSDELPSMICVKIKFTKPDPYQPNATTFWTYIDGNRTHFSYSVNKVYLVGNFFRFVSFNKFTRTDNNKDYEINTYIEHMFLITITHK